MKKVWSFKKNIDQMQKDEFSCNKNLMHSRRNDNIENRITELQKKTWEFKSEFSSKFDKFKTKFSKYADAMQKSEPTELITNISTKLNFVAEK